MNELTTRIDQQFAALRTRAEKGFIAYITAGDPNLEATYDHILALERAGVDVVELGIPFSDPLADGPVNQESAMRALAAGTTFVRICDLVRQVRKVSAIPLMCYCYMNLLYAPGFERSLRRAAQAGIDGMLILDLPAEEAGTYARALHDARLNLITLITPTTPDARMKRIMRHASGFVYVVSRTGVTGIQQTLANDAGALLQRARRYTDLPLALGFGIADPVQAAAAAWHADAVVVGSALVKRWHAAGSSRTKQRRVAAWIREMVQAVKGV